ncbi:hypothetical protein [Sphingobacterium hungaricum]|uniref:Uncharacterized protein n=1 Tax=Sphingobacterium hungaricum TaxID=2082723 RepID=A0A928UXW4_9SPHI|nr:hypothetical protein [Sphingobacterium hungaricum]MBE8715261.1 hypothetical protein [Sphingobacterium hungaricum]
MSKTRIFSFIAIWLLPLQTVVAQDALKDAEKTLKELANLLLEGTVWSSDLKFAMVDYNMGLSNEVQLIGDHILNGEGTIYFVNDSKLDYKFKDNFYEFSAKNKEASITDQDGNVTKSTVLFKVEDINKDQADSLVLLFQKLYDKLQIVSKENSQKEALKAEAEATLLEKKNTDKKVFYQTIKTLNTEKHFIRIPIPNTPNKGFKSYTFFDNPLELNGNFYSGFRFTPDIDGYLYWYFKKIEGERGDFYIVNVDKNVDDSALPYLSRMAFHKDENGKLSWIIQKSNEMLKKGNTYILWFVSDTKIPAYSKNISIQMETTADAKLSEYFKDHFKSTLYDY